MEGHTSISTRYRVVACADAMIASEDSVINDDHSAVSIRVDSSDSWFKNIRPIRLFGILSIFKNSCICGSNACQRPLAPSSLRGGA